MGASHKFTSYMSALTDLALQENHVINWADASVIDREPDRPTRWIKEAIHIRKEGQRAMNREEGSYQLSHAYDCFLGTYTTTYCTKNRMKKWYFHSSDEDLQWKSKRQGIKYCWSYLMNLYIRPDESIRCSVFRPSLFMPRLSVFSQHLGSLWPAEHIDKIDIILTYKWNLWVWTRSHPNRGDRFDPYTHLGQISQTGRDLLCHGYN